MDADDPQRSDPQRESSADTGTQLHVSGVPGPKRAKGRAGMRQMHVGSALQACAELANRQHGVVARNQLLAAGVTPDVVKGLVSSGGLHRLHRGVYAVGHVALPALAREQAALLACGAPSLISDRSALHLWGLADRPAEVHVAAVGHHCRERSGIRLRLLGGIDERDLRRRGGLPVTSPARTIVDWAPAASPVELEDVVAEARVRRLIRDGELQAALERAGQARGTRTMRRFLAEEGGSGMTRSRAERRFRGLLRQAELPEPETNRAVAGLEVDFLWSAEQVVLEVDGWSFHGHRRAFERDRRRDMILTAAGFLVIRVTWRQFTEQPLIVIAHVARMLDRHGRVRAPESAQTPRPSPH